MSDVIDINRHSKKCLIFSENDEIPYVIGGLLTDSTIFKISVEEAIWCKFYKAPGIGAVQIMPERKFLVINTAIKNYGAQSLAIPRSLPPVFTLLDEQGAEYAVRADHVFAGRNLTRKILSGSAIHPKLPLKGELVFDVTVGNYSLVVSRGMLNMNGDVKRVCDIGRYKLTPQETRPADSDGSTPASS